MSAKGVPGVRSATGPLGFGLHEGDWEMIQIAVPEDGGTPVAATYAAHDHGTRASTSPMGWKTSGPAS